MGNNNNKFGGNNNNNSFWGSNNNYGDGNNSNNKGSGITYSTNISQKSLMKHTLPRKKMNNLSSSTKMDNNDTCKSKSI